MIQKEKVLLDEIKNQTFVLNLRASGLDENVILKKHIIVNRTQFIKAGTSKDAEIKFTHIPVFYIGRKR